MKSTREVIARAAEGVIFRRVVLGKPIDGYTLEVSQEIRDAILSALSEAGLVIVPREPTEAMLLAARDWSVATIGRAVGNTGAIGCYRAMLSKGEQG